MQREKGLSTGFPCSPRCRERQAAERSERPKKKRSAGKQAAQILQPSRGRGRKRTLNNPLPTRFHQNFDGREIQLLGRGQTGALERLKTNLDEARQDRTWHDVLEARSFRLQNRLSPVLLAITFEPNDRAAQLTAAIDHFKTNEGNVGSRAPTEFLGLKERAASIRADGTVRISLYKVFLFQHITAAIKSGDLNLAQSYKYRPMDAYLIEPRSLSE